MKQKSMKAWAVGELGIGIAAHPKNHKKHTPKCKGGCTCDPDTWQLLVYQTKKGALAGKHGMNVFPITILLPATKAEK